VQPLTAPLANPRYLAEGVYGPPNGGASRCHYRNHRQPFPLELIKLHVQGSWI